MPAVSDTEYLNLAKNPEANQEQLQSMVDQAAKKAGYGIKGFHGTLSKELRNNAFDDEDAPYRGGLVAFFAEDRKFAEEYAKNGGKIIEAYLRLQNPLDFRNKQLIKESVSDFYSQTSGITEPYDIHRLEVGDGKDADAGNEYADYPADLFEDALLEGQWDAFEATEFAEWVNQQGYDGIVMKENNSITFAVYEPTQIKSADPVTYDKEGNVIPLSQRFQTTTPDIRFMPAEQGAEPEGLPLSDATAPERQQQVEKPLGMVALPKKPTPVERTMQADAGDFSVVIGGKPGKYGFGYTTIADLTP